MIVVMSCRFCLQVLGDMDAESFLQAARPLPHLLLHDAAAGI